MTTITTLSISSAVYQRQINIKRRILEDFDVNIISDKTFSCTEYNNYLT